MTSTKLDVEKPDLRAYAVFKILAIALIVFVPLVVLIGRTIGWYRSGHWFVVTIADVIGYLSTHAYAALIVGVGALQWDVVRNVIYYVVDDAPAEIVSVCVGVVMYIVTAVAKKRATAKNK